MIYSINERPWTYFSPRASELVFDAHKNYLFDLSYLTGLQVSGPPEKAQAFLQGQLTCDLREVDPQKMQRGALCNLQGRILALLDVVDWPSHHGFHLFLPQDLLSSTQSALNKAAMLSRLSLSPLTNYHCLGFYQQNDVHGLPITMDLKTNAYAFYDHERFAYYALGKGFYIFLIKTEDTASFCQGFIDADQWRGSLAWHFLQLKHGGFEIYPNTRARFLPHRVGLQHSGHVSFNKGCYKGQEIIVRMQHRATQKHAMKTFHLQTEDALFAGQTIFSSDGTRELGELIDYSPLEQEGQFLVLASLHHDSPGVLYFENHQNPLAIDYL
jgi:folate-binding protein YgfZ